MLPGFCNDSGSRQDELGRALRDTGRGDCHDAGINGSEQIE